MNSPAEKGMPVTFASSTSCRAVSGFLRHEATSPYKPPKIPIGGSVWRSPSHE
jgi:hypothetical protein